MEKLRNLITKKITIEFLTQIVLLFILAQPVLDILSFLNVNGYIPGISTIIKPLFVFGIGAYIFFSDKQRW